MRLIDADECLAFLKENCSKDMYLAVRAILDPCKTVNAVVIPENTTNGDMIKTLFPNAKFDNAMPFTDGRWETIDLDTENKIRGTHKPTQLRVYADWWNAPYKTNKRN